MHANANGAAKTATKWESYRAHSRRDWGQQQQPKAMDRDGVMLGTMLRTADAEERIASALALLAGNSGSISTFLMRISDAIARKCAAPAAAPTREDREAASRARAWAAYRRAGGTAADESGDGLTLADVGAGNVRVRMVFRKMGLTTLADLLALTADDLLECRNFGTSSVAHVRAKLAEHGLRLKGE